MTIGVPPAKWRLCGVAHLATEPELYSFHLQVYNDSIAEAFADPVKTLLTSYPDYTSG